MVGHQRTLLVGDLNVDPFSPGVVRSRGFHGIMSRQVTLGMSRIIQGRSYPFFYNPMWSLYGDHPDGPAGSYFYDASGEHVNYYWHMFDQVLIRPSLIPYFPLDRLMILHRIGSASLLDAKGRPNGNTGSDHLPLLFTINQEPIGVEQ